MNPAKREAINPKNKTINQRRFRVSSITNTCHGEQFGN
jgi:hypothetical protein